MTNEEKANEIREDYTKGGYRETVYAADLEDALKEMAEWKDEQYAKEKKQWIEKAQHVLGNILVGGAFPQDIQGFIKQFQQAMEE